jgi:hypothetical protein
MVVEGRRSRSKQVRVLGEIQHMSVGQPVTQHSGDILNSVGQAEARAGQAVLQSHRERLRLLAACLDWSTFEKDAFAPKYGLDIAGLPWREISTLANQELLAPTLWARLRAKDLAEALPFEVAAYLRRAHAVNTVRNERIKAQLVDAIQALNALHIEPVLLKGSVDLFISRYDDPGARILRDVDLFIRLQEIERARAALVAAGYRELPRESGKFVTYGVEFTRSGAVVPCDVQWYISGQRGVLPPEEAFRHSVRHQQNGLCFRTLCANHQIVHNLLHSELQDRGADLGFVWLRQLLDLAALCRQLGDQIAWKEVQDHFVRLRMPRLLSKRLYMAHQLLGMPMPAGIKPTLAARLHYHRCIGQLRWDWLTKAMRFWATMTSPIDPRLLDLLYDSGPSGRWDPILQVRHAARLLHRHRNNLRGVIRKRHMKFDQA